MIAASPAITAETISELIAVGISSLPPMGWNVDA